MIRSHGYVTYAPCLSMSPLAYFTLVGAIRPWHGRTVQILVSLSSLHWGFLLVIREDTPIPQLREHWDHSVVWTRHFFSFTWFHSEGHQTNGEGGKARGTRKNHRHQLGQWFPTWWQFGTQPRDHFQI